MLVSHADIQSLVAAEVQRQLARIERLAKDPWLDPEAIAQHAGLSRYHVLRMIRAGRGPRVAGEGKLMRARRTWVDSWLERQHAGTALQKQSASPSPTTGGKS